MATAAGHDGAHGRPLLHRPRRVVAADLGARPTTPRRRARRCASCARRRRPVREVLELGSGGGNNAVHLKADLDLTLVDLNAEMVAVSQRLNPECVHAVGDMRTVRLGRTFDAVFVHDAIDYMLTEDDLRAAMVTAFEHCRPGGVVVLDARRHHRELGAGDRSRRRGRRRRPSRPLPVVGPRSGPRRHGGRHRLRVPPAGHDPTAGPRSSTRPIARACSRRPRGCGCSPRSVSSRCRRSSGRPRTVRRAPSSSVTDRRT